MIARVGFSLAFALTLVAGRASAENDAADLAKKLANPLASMISVPTQINFDENLGAEDDGSQLTINVQPVIPFALNENWLLVTRTVIPIVDQDDIPVDGASDSGLGDILQSYFLSPSKATGSGWIWGAGPAVLFPTATENELGLEQLAIGPTAVALKQSGKWTYGALANHLWKIDGDDDRENVNASYLEPWISYITKMNTTVSFSIESTYDWTAEEASVPLVFTVDQFMQLGDFPISVGGALKYWADTPDGGPEDFGFRLQFTLLFPK